MIHTRFIKNNLKNRNLYFFLFLERDLRLIRFKVLKSFFSKEL